jgi:TPR repeat protein
MRRLCLCLWFVVAISASAQVGDNKTVASGDAIASKKIELAKESLQRIADLVNAGALPKVRLEEAQIDFMDAEDDAILARTLYAPIQNRSEKMGDEMVAAAQRRVERWQNRLVLAQKMVADGVVAASSLTPLQDELKMRELNLDLARSRAKLIGELASPVKRYRLAAEQGDATAQFNLGLIYKEGQGVLLQDYKEAARWFRLAAEQGHASAQFNLGFMYDNGQGEPQDYKEAVKWDRLAAEQGNEAAQNNLGRMYPEGLGVPRDYIQAHMWFNLAGVNNDATAIENRDMVARKMTPGQIAEAQRLAREWKPKPIH